MDSPAVVLENSSSFLSVPQRLELFLHVLLLQSMMEISVSTDISVFGFYGYIGDKYEDIST